MEYIQGKAASVSTSSIPSPSPPTAAPIAPVAAPVLVPVTHSPAKGSSLIPTTAIHVAAWKKMVAKYGYTYLPFHEYQLAKITNIWTEWVSGLNGYLSTRELEEGCGPTWRRNQKGLKTDCSRRKKVADLITQLAAKRNWTVDLTLRFIRDQYELARKPDNVFCFPTARSFCDFLQKKRGDG
ncbi:hypothetical protein C8J57DRAFT_1590123 [Mycena rebaudengoi]|nr:hypothetical protein C8J57DRAFT_1590123 [Mycena rebaudengoi]